MMGTGYKKSHLEPFARDLAARVDARLPVMVGEPEDARAWGTKPTLLLRHPEDGRTILELAEVTDHRHEIDVFAEVTETLEALFVAPDYETAFALYLTVADKGIKGATKERDGQRWLSALSLGDARKPRKNELLPQGVPQGYFVLIALLQVTWLASRQEALSAVAESLAVDVEMTDGSVTVGATKIPEETPP